MSPITRLPSAEEELIEEALAEIYVSFEKGERLAKTLEELLEKEVVIGIFAKLKSRGLIAISGNNLQFSTQAEKLASNIIRRKRLTERLLHDVLNIGTEQTGQIACQFEHVLSEEIADSICTLLGHPSQCPHGHLIPQGECCKKLMSSAAPVVITLDKLESGRAGRIAYLLFHKNPELERLLSLGFTPGREIQMIQRFPTFVLQMGEAEIALDETIARSIFVRPI